MTPKIDELNSRYLVPGIDLGTAASTELDGLGEDPIDSPYGQLPPLMEIPSPTGWQDLLGLNHAAPSPSQIDPPPRPTSHLGVRATNSATTSQRRQGPGGGTRASAPLKVNRMKAMLARYEQMVRRIHARATGGGR